MFPSNLDRLLNSSGKNDNAITCTTFNILAPIYKRIGGEGCRESQFRDVWLGRNKKILDKLLHDGSSIICLQEYWLGNDELVQLYEGSLADAGYQIFTLPRTNNRGDGLLTAIHDSRLKVINDRKLLFDDCWDRVAHIFHLRVKIPFYKRSQAAGPDLLLVNTHLLFPHDSTFCIIRLQQVYQLIECLERFREEHGLLSVPVILCGDWNGSKRGHVYKFLRSQGFVSSYDLVRPDAHRWVSHRNHRGNICGVDFIWLRNPNMNRKCLLESLEEAAVGIIFKAKLKEIGEDAFFVRDNGVKISRSECWRILQELGWSDILKEFKNLMQHCAPELTDRAIELKTDDEQQCPANSFLRYDDKGNLTMHQDGLPANMGNDFAANQVSDNGPAFKIERAFLYPPEVEQGSWPEDYWLSDHAPLTAIFTPSST